jgi:DNA invertase Pin-like site-specific DNA recombinase
MLLRVGYCRVSTASAEQQQALPVQRARIELESPDLILSDVESGLNPDRPGYQELRRLVEAGRVAEVVATEFSRLGRDATESDAFVRLCDAQGVICRTIAEGQLTMSTPEGLLLTRLRGSLNEGESMRLSRRIHRGLEQGRRLGKPMRKPAWPYRLSSDRLNLEPDPEQWPIALAFVEHLRAHGWRTMRALDSFPHQIPLSSCRAVRAWLLNPTTRGGLGYRQGANHNYAEVIWDRHPAVVSHADFAAYQAASAQNRRFWGSNAKREQRALTGLCRCSECAWRMKYISGRTVSSLRCSGPGCPHHYAGIREAVVVEWLIDQLAAHAATWLAQKVSQRHDPMVAELQRQVEALERLNDPDLAEAIAQKQGRIVQLQQQGPSVDPELVERISRPQWWQAAPAEALVTVLHSTVKEVLIDMSQRAPIAVEFRF